MTITPPVDAVGVVRAREPAQRPPRESRLEHAAFALVLLGWLLYVLPARGGWEKDVIPIACVVMLPSLLVLRPWRHCSRTVHLLAAAPALGALVVAAASPFGDGGPISLARWGLFGTLLLATASFARTNQRRTIVAGALMLSGLLQFSQAWLPWWGGGADVDGPMLGTIYSANPFGSLMLGFALLAGGVGVLADPPIRRLGLLVSPLCAAAVVLSGARAAIMILTMATALLALLAFRAGGGRGVLRCTVLLSLTWAVLALSTSSVFFSGSSSALQATNSKQASGQTLDATTGVRVDYWRAAWGEFTDRPVLGGGSGSYMGASRLRMPAGAERSPYAHNEVLGALAEGGLALGLPVLALVLLSLLGCSRVLLAGLSTPARTDPVRVAVSLAVGGLIGHAMLDFALSFPAILGLLGIMLGVVLSHGVPVRRPGGHALWGLLVVPVVLCGGYLGWSHDRTGVSSQAVPGTSEPLPGARDARVIVRDARQALQASDPARAVRAAAALRPLAALDGQLEALRLDLLDLAGHDTTAQARQLAQASRERAPLLLVPFAERLSAEVGADLLLAEVYHRADEGGRLRPQLVDLVEEAERLAFRPEPGWTCALGALQRAGELADDIAVPSGAAREAGTPRCATWAAQASTQLGVLP